MKMLEGSKISYNVFVQWCVVMLATHSQMVMFSLHFKNANVTRFVGPNVNLLSNYFFPSKTIFVI
jgi:hypothetical protein